MEQLKDIKSILRRIVVFLLVSLCSTINPAFIGQTTTTRTTTTTSADDGQHATSTYTSDVTVNLQCRVFNWTTMNCTWNHPSNSSEIYKLWRYAYFHETCPIGQKGYTSCPLHRGNVCTWLVNKIGNPIQLNIPQWFMLTASDSARNFSVVKSCELLDLRDYIEPDSVSNIDISHASSTSLRINLISSSTRNMTYRIHYSSSCHSGNVTTSEAFVHLIDLWPGVEYNITVDCSPCYGDPCAQRGLWSRPTSASVRLREDVPRIAPLVIHGGFYIWDITKRRRKINIFLRSITEFCPPGKYTGARVRFANLQNASVPSIWDTEFCSVKVCILSLDADSMYLLKFDMSTRAGFNESLLPSYLNIPRQKDVPDSPLFTVVVNASSYSVFWPRVPQAIGYTLFWCLSMLHISLDQYCTERGINWMSVSSDQEFPSAELQFNDSPYSIGMSVEYNTSGTILSSGIRWTSCVYDATMPVQSPSKVNVVPLVGGKLLVEWEPVECRYTGYISNFIVEYCLKSKCSGVNMDVKTINVTSSVHNVTVIHLFPGEVYQVRIKSSSPYAESNYTSVDATVLSNGISKGQIFGMVIFLVFVIICTGVILHRLKTKAKRRFTKKIDVVVPAIILTNNISDSKDLKIYWDYNSDIRQDVNESENAFVSAVSRPPYQYAALNLQMTLPGENVSAEINDSLHLCTSAKDTPTREMTTESEIQVSVYASLQAPEMAAPVGYTTLSPSACPEESDDRSSQEPSINCWTTSRESSQCSESKRADVVDRDGVEECELGSLSSHGSNSRSYIVTYSLFESNAAVFDESNPSELID